MHFTKTSIKIGIIIVLKHSQMKELEKDSFFSFSHYLGWREDSQTSNKKESSTSTHESGDHGSIPGQGTCLNNSLASKFSANFSKTAFAQKI